MNIPALIWIALGVGFVVGASACLSEVLNIRRSGVRRPYHPLLDHPLLGVGEGDFMVLSLLFGLFAVACGYYGMEAYLR
jgi:hypothetical protein